MFFIFGVMSGGILGESAPAPLSRVLFVSSDKFLLVNSAGDYLTTDRATAAGTLENVLFTDGDASSFLYMDGSATSALLKG